MKILGFTPTQVFSKTKQESVKTFEAQITQQLLRIVGKPTVHSKLYSLAFNLIGRCRIKY